MEKVQARRWLRPEAYEWSSPANVQADLAGPGGPHAHLEVPAALAGLAGLSRGGCGSRAFSGQMISYSRPTTSLQSSQAARSKRATGGYAVGDRGCIFWRSFGESSAC